MFWRDTQPVSVSALSLSSASLRLEERSSTIQEIPLRKSQPRTPSSFPYFSFLLGSPNHGLPITDSQRPGGKV